MMSVRYWFLLLIAYVIYLLIGGFGFQALESPHECFRTMSHRSYFIDYLKEVNISRDDSKIIYSFFVNRSSARGTKDFVGGGSNLTQYMADVKKNKHNDTSEPELDCDKWDFFNSFVFVFTASTTIGYGQLSPVSWQGKLLCIFYSLIGIPINGILIAWLGSFFATKLEALRDYGDDSDIDDDLNKKKRGEIFTIFSIILNVIVYLIPGVGVFVLIPAGIFHYVEGWSYFDSVYFAYITLTTIGFGDFAAGRNVEALERLKSWAIVYEIFILIWIIFGLGYIFMIITIITDGIRKPVRRAVKKIERSFLKRIIQEIVERQDLQFELERASNLSRQEPFYKDLGLENDPYLKKPSTEGKFELNPDNRNKSFEENEEEDPFDYNRDTIRSLQQFFEKNKKAHPSDVSSSIKKRRSALMNRKNSRRTVSMQHPPDMVIKSGMESEKKRRMSSYIDERSLQRGSHDSDRKSSASEMSFPQFLKNTTLEDFLSAANTVSYGNHPNILYAEPSNSTTHSPQSTIHTGMRKLSNIASSSMEPFSKFFTGNGNQDEGSRRNPSTSDNHVPEPPTRIIISSASSSSSSERKDDEINA